jgi:hypothetical protein
MRLLETLLVHEWEVVVGNWQIWAGREQQADLFS